MPLQPVTWSLLPGRLVLMRSWPLSSVAMTWMVTVSFGLKLGLEAETSETPTRTALTGVFVAISENTPKADATNRGSKRKRRDIGKVTSHRYLHPALATATIP